MYFWKCWRDTRVKFLVALGLFLCLEIASFFNPGHITTGKGPAPLQSAFLVVVVIASYVVAFMGWILGDDNPGADIGRGSGDFLLTRPASRGSLIWTGWTLGMAESIVLWIVFSAVLMADMAFQIRDSGSVPFVSSAWFTFCTTEMPILFLMFVINLGLIYGLTYCIGVIMRSGSRALIGSAAVLVGYEILKSVLLQRFHMLLPGIFLAYPTPDHAFVSPSIHALVIRALIALAFPVLSHFVLERAEI